MNIKAVNSIKKIMYIIMIVIITGLVFAFSSENTKLSTSFNTINNLNNRIAKLEQENVSLKHQNEDLEEDSKNRYDEAVSYRKALNNYVSKIESVKLNEIGIGDIEVDTFISKRYRLGELFPWLTEGTIESCTITNTTFVEDAIVKVPSDILQNLNFSEMINSISRVQSMNMGHPPSEVNTYEFNMIVDGENHTIKSCSQFIIIIDDIWMVCVNQLHNLGDALCPNPYYQSSQNMLEKMLNSSLVVTKVYFNCVNTYKFRAKGVLPSIKKYGEKLSSNPNDYGDLIEQFDLYNQGNIVSVFFYGDYLCIKDEKMNDEQWYYGEDLSNKVMCDFFAGG